MVQGISPKALVVLSGGMDSAVALWVAHERYEGQVATISFHYGQKHAIELQHARMLSAHLNVPHGIYEMSPWSFHTALTSDNAVPEGHYAQETMKQTVVPNRNSIFLNIAAGIAMDIGASYVFTGVHAGDHPIYPDCRPEFINELNRVIEVGNEGFNPPHILAPFMQMEKAEIATIGKKFEVPFHLTWSCYKGGVPNKNITHPGQTAKPIHCGRCSTCVERLEAMYIAGVEDKTSYADTEFWRSVVDG